MNRRAVGWERAHPGCMNYCVSIFPSNSLGLLVVKPEVPAQSGLYDTPIAFKIPSSIDFSIQSGSTTPDLITDEARESFVQIKYQNCRYGIYVFSEDLCQICGKLPNWNALSYSLISSGPSYALIQLEGGRTLSIIIFRDDGIIPAVRVRARTSRILESRDGWMSLLKPEFLNVITGQVTDLKQLANIMCKCDPLKLKSPYFLFLCGLWREFHRLCHTDLKGEETLCQYPTVQTRWTRNTPIMSTLGGNFGALKKRRVGNDFFESAQE